jgi:hypothetical protein
VSGWLMNHRVPLMSPRDTAQQQSLSVRAGCRYSVRREVWVLLVLICECKCWMLHHACVQDVATHASQLPHPQPRFRYLHIHTAIHLPSATSRRAGPCCVKAASELFKR